MFDTAHLQDIEAEKAVLACAMMHDEGALRLLDLLRPEMFYRDKHQAITRAIQRLVDAGTRVDMITIADELGPEELLLVGGRYELAGILEHGLISPAGLPHHAAIIREKYQRRRLLDAIRNIERDLASPLPIEEILAAAETRILTAGDGETRRGSTPLSPHLQDALAGIAAAHARGGKITGVPTGLPLLDWMTGGLQPRELVILAARPGMGKSALMMNLAEQAGMAGRPVAIFSLEMSGTQLAQRVLCGRAGVDLHKARTGKVDVPELDALRSAAEQLASLPITIDDTAVLSIGELRAACRRLKREKKVDLVCVDYLQLMRSGDDIENRVQEVAAISRGLKALAKELDVPVLALSQLSRASEHREKSRPQLSDLRDSGQIEQDADLVMFIWREGMYDKSAPQDTAELIISKQRSGPVGSIELHFDRARTTFTQLDSLLSAK